MKRGKVAAEGFCWSLLWEEYFLLANYDYFRDVLFIVIFNSLEYALLHDFWPEEWDLILLWP